MLWSLVQKLIRACLRARLDRQPRPRPRSRLRPWARLPVSILQQLVLGLELFLAQGALGAALRLFMLLLAGALVLLLPPP